MYCFVGDLSGYKNLIKNLPLGEQKVRINQWIQLIQSTATRCQIGDYSIISDSVIIITDEKEEEFEKLLKFSQLLLENGINQNFPIRGAITVGEVERINQTFYGKAFVDAFLLSINQNWIGITLSNKFPEIERFFDVELMVLYPPPLKEEPIRLHPVVSWKIPKIDDLLKLTLGGGLTKKGDLLNWDYYNKIQNTVIFSLYIKKIKKMESDSGKKVNIKQFQGLAPLQFIEMEIDKTPVFIQ